MVNFPTQVPDCDSHSLALSDFFLSSDIGICCTMAFAPLGNSDPGIYPSNFDVRQTAQKTQSCN